MEKFTRLTLSEIRDRAIREYINAPTRFRFTEMVKDLTESERITLSYFDASITVLNRMGVLDIEALMQRMPNRFTEVQEVLDEGVVGHHITKQK